MPQNLQAEKPLKAASPPPKITETNPVIIYTDGACSGNPGPGGWGALMLYKGHEKELIGGASETTNNRMEMMAAVEALKSLKRPCHVQLHTDSLYLRDGIQKWLKGWKARGWKTADRKPVKNQDLWQALEAAAATHHIEWFWVKGHAGDAGNERADSLARQGMAPYKPDSAETSK